MIIHRLWWVLKNGVFWLYGVGSAGKVVLGKGSTKQEILNKLPEHALAGVRFWQGKNPKLPVTAALTLIK